METSSAALASVSYNPNNKVVTDILNKLSRVKGVQITINSVIPKDNECSYNKEYLEMIAESEKQFENGEFYRMNPNQSVEEFLDELCTL